MATVTPRGSRGAAARLRRTSAPFADCGTSGMKPKKGELSVHNLELFAAESASQAAEYIPMSEQQATPESVMALARPIIELLSMMPTDDKVSAINALREMIHQHSPFSAEPVDFVRWVKNTQVHANDYNPNSVAPPEMELLHLSIQADGYTQPIVSMPDPDGRFEVIDGFHRHRVGKEKSDIAARVHGYLPLVEIRESQKDKTDRMAATIRHNRARGKHRVEAMSDIVIELKRRNWSDDKIAKNLGMDADEVLRLCQLSGIAELFHDDEFSASWDIEHFDDDVVTLEDDK